MLVVGVGVEQVRVLGVVEAVGKVDAAVGKVLVLVGLALADGGRVALVAEAKRHDGVVLLKRRHGEVQAGVVVVVHVEDGPHGAGCELHAPDLGVVVWDEAVERHGELEQLAELGLGFQDHRVALPAYGNAVLRQPVVDDFDRRRAVPGDADEGGCSGDGAPDAEGGVAGAVAEGLAAASQSVEGEDLVRGPEGGTEEPGDGSFRDGVAVVLVLLDLLLEVKNQVTFLAELDGEMDKGD